MVTFLLVHLSIESTKIYLLAFACYPEPSLQFAIYNVLNFYPFPKIYLFLHEFSPFIEDCYTSGCKTCVYVGSWKRSIAICDCWGSPRGETAGLQQFCCKLEIKKKIGWGLGRSQGLRLDLPTLKKWMLDVKVNSVWGQQLRLDAKLQVPDLRKQKKSIILCWCFMSSWCYFQNVFHMSYFLSNLSSLTPARIHRSRVNQFACLHMFFSPFFTGVPGEKTPKTTSSQALVKERQGRGLHSGFQKIGACRYEV